MDKKEWWALVIANWKDILSFCEEYLPMDSHQDYDGEDTPQTVRQHIIAAYEHKDHKLARYLGEAWFLSPETGTGSIWAVMNTLYNEEPEEPLW